MIAFTLMLCSGVLIFAEGAVAPGQPQHARPAPYYSHPLRVPPHALEYFLESPEPGYYNAVQHKSEGSPARLENLEPDNEVELLPGAAQPQQPPQRTPVSPTVPGLHPGQRFYIIHHPMAILPNGYRPGVQLGGYQPVYVVAAAPSQGEYALPGYQGYQSAIVLDPTGQAAYGGRGAGVAGAPATAGAIPPASLGYPRPLDFLYPDPALAFQNGPGAAGAVRLAQLVSLQGAAPAHRPPQPHSTSPEGVVTSERQRVGDGSESRESGEQSQSSSRPAPSPPHPAATRPATATRSKPK